MFEQEREELAEILKQKKITDKYVLEAFSKVERHLFVPDVIKLHSYKDVALPIGYEQTISQPYTVAFMTQALQVKTGDKVLEIGTGSGFQAAILLAMGVKVFSIERNHDIYLRTQKLFDELSLRAALRFGDGTIGWDEYAPYNGIVVTAGGPTIPQRLVKQLAVNGRMVIPIGNRKTQTMKIITKVSEDEFQTEDIPNFTFVPLIGKEGWKEE